ncbi:MULTISPECIES: MarR family winged helix-turn-helix transcriptional regulator [Clostridium]|uniref:MarR family winged helix-turn-helix transcriptional regulator n=1 Tax=Clostridium TaxID=1485 RepID=UPI00082508E9|nr:MULTISPECIES: MarR family transcriptional regulator [Clostridium]PJI07241.1 MarR family transcriptional regulator [Clostridium sp. CT7]
MAEYLKIKHTSVIDLAKRLEEKDMIRRFKDEENRRYKNVVITQKEITVMKKFNNRKKESVESILDNNMTKEEQRILKELLQKVLCCLEKL